MVSVADLRGLAHNKASPTFHRMVGRVHSRVQRFRHGIPPEEMGGTKLENNGSSWNISKRSLKIKQGGNREISFDYRKRGAFDSSSSSHAGLIAPCFISVFGPHPGFLLPSPRIYAM
ncbi:hypothetical protein BJX64DRAFT_164313 [Aspergillus heterothallicus]